MSSLLDRIKLSGALGNKKTNDSHSLASTLTDESLLEEMKKREEDSVSRFPLEVFPSYLKPLIANFLEDKEIEPCFIGTTMLAAMSTAIGSGLKVQFGTFREKVNIYTCLVGYTSSGKSLVSDPFFRPLKEIEKANERAKEEAQRNAMEDENDKDEWKPIDKSGTLMVSGTTTAALVDLLAQNPRGFCADFDEFVSWFQDMKRIKTNADAVSVFTQFWNSSYDHRVDRKRERFLIPAETLFITMFGGTQPDLLHNFFDDKKAEQGFTQRFLFAFQRVYTVAEPDIFAIEREDLYNTWNDLIHKTYKTYNVYSHGTNGTLFRVERVGLKVYDEWRKEARKWADNGVNASDRSTRMGIYGKLKQYCVRFAGILHAMNLFENPNYRINKDIPISEWQGIGTSIPDNHIIPSGTVRKATMLCTYFLHSNYFAHQYTSNVSQIPPEIIEFAATLKALKYNQKAVAMALGKSRPTIKKWIVKYQKMYPQLFKI